MRIVAAAIKVNGLTLSLPAPARHCDIMRRMHAKDAKHCRPLDQGFLTDGGVFLGREDARKVAVAAEQLLPRAQAHSKELFSEDLW